MGRKPCAWTSISTMLKWTVVFASLFSVVILYVSQQITMMNMAYKIPQLREEIARIAEENKELETEVAYLESPQRLERLAAEMGMVPVANRVAGSESPKAQN